MNENLTDAKPGRWVVHRKGVATGIYPHSRHLLPSIIVAVVFLIPVLIGLAGYIGKWLWMRQLGYTGIFWKLLSVRWAMFGSASLFAFLFLWINLRLAARNSAAFAGDDRAGLPAFSVQNRLGRLGEFASYHASTLLKIYLCCWRAVSRRYRKELQGGASHDF